MAASIPTKGQKMRYVMKFGLMQMVMISASKEIARVVGRVEFIESEPAYFLYYQNINGAKVTQMWSQSALEAISCDSPLAAFHNETCLFICKLQPWVSEQQKNFTLKETLEFLNLNPELGDTMRALPAIVEALGALGWEHMAGTFTRTLRRVSKDEIIT